MFLETDPRDSLLDLGQPAIEVMETIRQMNREICQEFAKCPHGSKQSKLFAEVMGLSHKQLRTVVDVSNPECFGQRTDRHGLTAGRAFDIVLGDGILQKGTKKEIIRYITQVKPSLVLISPPCKLYSQLQNLSKHKRETNPELMIVDAPFYYGTSQGKKVAQVCN